MAYMTPRQRRLNGTNSAVENKNTTYKTPMQRRMEKSNAVELSPADKMARIKDERLEPKDAQYTPGDYTEYIRQKIISGTPEKRIAPSSIQSNISEEKTASPGIDNDRKILYVDFNGNPVYDKNPDLIPVKETDSWIVKQLKGVPNFIGKNLDALSKFNDVVGAKMRQTIFGDNTPYEDPRTTPTTGNKAVDTVGNVAGTIEGFFMPSGGGAPSFAGPIRQAAENVVSKIGGKSLPGIAGKVVDKALTGVVESVPYSAQMIAVNEDLQNPKEAAKAVAENILFGAASEAALVGLGAIGKAIKDKIKTKIPLNKVELDAIETLPDSAKAEIKQALPETMPGEIGNQKPVKNIDDYIREQKQKVDDLRYQRNELGIDTAKEIEAGENELLRLQKKKYLPYYKEQLADLEKTQKEIFAANNDITPEFVDVSDRVNTLKQRISDIESSKVPEVSTPSAVAPDGAVKPVINPENIQKPDIQNRAVNDIQKPEITTEVPNQFKGTQPGELDYKPVSVGLQTQIVTETPKGKTTPFKYADPELEKVHLQNKGIKPETLASKVKSSLSELKDMFSRPIKTLPVKGNEQLYYGRNGLINLSKARERTGDETTRIIADITKEFKQDKNAFDIFQRKVFLDDMAQEVKLGNKLPNRWTPETVASELERLNQAMPESVKNAVEKRKQHWTDVKKRYVGAMEDIGVNMEDRLTREDYFRHQVLDYMDAKNAVLRGTGTKLKTPANRGFTKARTGEYTGNINTDYIQAEYEVMAQMLHDTEIAKTIKLIETGKDITSKLKEEAKKQGVDNWKELIPEGYTTWQPREGNVFYMHKPIAQEAVESNLKLRGLTMNDIKDPKIKVILEDIFNDLEANQKELLVMGGKRKEFIIPQEVADTLNNMLKNKPTNRLARYFQNTHTLWKRWMLYLNPRNAFKYATRNTVGDLDAVIAGNPSGVTKTFRSMTELADAMRNGKFTPELKSFYDMGGYQATQAAQEITQVNKLKPFEAFRDGKSLGEKLATPFKKYEEFMSDTNAYREMVLRYGSYLDYLDQLNKGQLKNYGASKKSVIDALETNEEKAFKLANDLLGAYDNVSEAGKFLRRQFIPFYSWLETNFKRYSQLLTNAISTGDAGTAAKTAAGIGVKAGASVVRKMGGIFALTGVLAAWNTLKYPELEETLPADVKAKPHVILGKDKDGNTIYFSRLGSLNDFLEWFGLDNAWQDGIDILNGKKTIMEQLQDMVKSPINKVATGLRPEIKTAVELTTGKKFYPDVFKPGNIRDKGQYFAQSLGLGNEYNEIFNKPHKSYASTIADIFKYTSNPKEAAYWSTLDLKSKFQKRKGDTGEGFYTSAKSNALYNYKLALRYDDKEAQDKYMKFYESYGGNSQQTIESVLSMSPYYGITKDDIPAFKNFLTKQQKDSLKLAEDYFMGLLESELTSKRPLSDGTRLMLDLYKQTYETKQFPKIVGNTVTYNAVKYKLTPEEVTELQGRVNDKMYDRADELAKNLNFKKLTPEKQADALSDALNKVVEIERNKWKAEKYSKK